MTTLSNYLQDALANFTFRGTAYASPATVYASLYETEPLPDDSGIELVGAGYTREVLSFAAPVGRTISSDGSVSFGPATANWNQANWLAIHDALTGGNLLSYSPLVPATAVANGDPLTIPIGNINVQLRGIISEYWAQQLLSHVYRNIAATAPTSLYMAIYSDDPQSDDSGTELSGNGYARQGVTFAAAVAGSVENDAQVDFPNSTPGAQGTCSHYGIKDASTAGNLITFGPWAAAASIVLNTNWQVPANAFAQKFGKIAPA